MKSFEGYRAPTEIGSQDQEQGAVRAKTEAHVSLARTLARLENLDLEREDAGLEVEIGTILDEIEKVDATSSRAKELTQELERKSNRKAEIKTILMTKMDEAEARVRVAA